jgi:tetratricopeptide (TPR) repeat protein
MSGEALYERYKDALKRGHVASLRGRIDEALTAYAEAAAIAPERPTPHTSAGTALLRLGRPADALRSYGAALEVAPRDEAAMLGRAQALEALGRRGEAAAAFDAVVELRGAADRLADALDAARRALELAEGRERRRTLRQLVDRLRVSEPDEPARAGLDQALRILDEPAVVPGFRIRGALDRDVPADVDPEALARAADEAVDAGRRSEALERLLDVAAAHRRMGNMDAALDACYLGLSVAPDEIGLHLALVELYGDRGWSELAAGKLDLLERLATLDGGDDALARVAAARSGSG